MKPYNKELSAIYIDIDDTLSPDFGETFFNGSIEKIKELSKVVNIVIWSQGGLDYVNEIVEKAGLKEYVCFCLPKPDLIIDDLKFDDFCGHKKITNGHLDWEFDIMSKLEGNWIEDAMTLREIKK